MKLMEIATSPPVTCRPTNTIREVARQMLEHDVGSIVVVDASDHIVGIVTDRDLVVRGLARQRPSDAPISTVMTHDVVHLRADADVDAACNEMSAWGMRRVPIVSEESVLVGMVTLDDLIEVLAEEIEKGATATRTRHEHRNAPGLGVA